MPAWKKIVVSGSAAELLHVTASISITSPGSVGFLGTASWAQSSSNAAAAATASYVTGSIFTGNNLATSASFAVNAGTSATASYVTGSIHTGNNLATSASFAITAGFALSAAAMSSLSNGTGISAFSYNGSSTAQVQISSSGLAANRLVKWTGDAFSGSLITDNGTTVIIGGDLQVQGTTTTVSSSNLLVADRFILLASGSTTATDGGIIVQSGSGGSGSAFYYDGDFQRWGFSTGLTSADTSATANSWVVNVSGSTGSPINTPVFGNTNATRIGAIYVDTNLGGTTDANIWIWS